MNIWVPKTKILEPKDELMLPGSRVSGYFKIEGRLDDGRRRVIADWQPNLILDAGLNRWGTGTILSHCCVGSGNTAPVVGDSALVTHVASTTVVWTSGTVQGSAPYYGYRVFTATFTPPGSNQNLSEIGAAWASGGASLFSRALIKDSGGSPTTITWLAAETLVVTWEFRNYPWLTDAEVSTTISVTDYDVILRPTLVTAAGYWMFSHGVVTITATAGGSPNPPIPYSGALGAITATPAGTYEARGSWGTENAYSAGSHKRTATASWGPTLANFGAGGIPSVAVYCAPGAYQIGFDPPIAKTNVDTLTLNLSTPVWGRYT